MRRRNKQRMKSVTGCLKPVFLVFDVVFWMLGTLLLIFIFWLMATNSVLREMFSAGTAYFTYTTLSIGLFIFFTTILGVIAAVKESTCLLKTYIVFVILILLAEIAGGVSAYLLRDRLDDYRQSIWLEFNRPTKDHIQTKLKCCGFTTYLEYGFTILELPDSCFVPGTIVKTANFLYLTGCWANINKWLNSFEGAAWACTVAAIALVEILCLVFAILMLVRILRASRVWSDFVKARRSISQEALAGTAKKPKAAIIRSSDDVYAGRKMKREATPMSLYPESGTRRQAREHYDSYKEFRAPEPEPVRSFGGGKIRKNDLPWAFDSPRRGYDTDFLRHYKPSRF